MSESAPAEPTLDWFGPTPGRLIFGAILAAIGFLLPQEVPLVWYPLNDPSPGTVQLEIACASSVDGTMQILYDNGPLAHTINVPMVKSAATYTYVFPLPDAPLTALRIDPF